MSDSNSLYREQDSDEESMDSAATLVSLLINAAERGVMVLCTYVVLAVEVSGWQGVRHDLQRVDHISAYKQCTRNSRPFAAPEHHSVASSKRHHFVVAS